MFEEGEENYKADVLVKGGWRKKEFLSLNCFTTKKIIINH